MDKNVMEEELKKGLEAANQLRSLLISSSKLSKKEISQFNDEKIRENYSTILNSFDTSISILKNMVQSLEWETSSVGKNTKGSQLKNRLRTINTSNLTPDGYTWRKYGQKPIHNTKHPREYFRCAYKDDQNCQATKHVQKTSDNPINYRITYYSHHTCQPILSMNSNDTITNVLNSPEKDSTNYISFESKNPISCPKQALINPITLNSSPSLPRTSDHPPPKTLDATTMILESSSLANDMACFNQEPDVVFSPRTFMNPNYVATSSNIEDVEDYDLVVGDFLDMSDALQDLPLWD